MWCNIRTYTCSMYAYIIIKILKIIFDSWHLAYDLDTVYWLRPSHGYAYFAAAGFCGLRISTAGVRAVDGKRSGPAERVQTEGSVARSYPGQQHAQGLLWSHCMLLGWWDATDVAQAHRTRAGVQIRPHTLLLCQCEHVGWRLLEKQLLPDAEGGEEVAWKPLPAPMRATWADVAEYLQFHGVQSFPICAETLSDVLWPKASGPSGSLQPVTWSGCGCLWHSRAGWWPRQGQGGKFIEPSVTVLYFSCFFICFASFVGVATHTGVWNSLLEYLFQIFGSLSCWKSILDLLNLSWMDSESVPTCILYRCCTMQGQRDDAAPARSSKVVEVIERVRASSAFIEDPDNITVTDDHVPEGDQEVARATLQVVGDENGEEYQANVTFMPTEEKTTLSGALASHENLQAALPDLWRLLWYLRSAKNCGSDQKILPDPMLTRQRVKEKKSKWHNVAMRQISLLDAASKQPAARQSRHQAWLQQMEAQRNKSFESLPSNLTIDTSDLAAVKLGTAWVPGLVMSIWRNFRGASGGGQLVAQELARGSLHCLRVVRNLQATVLCFYMFFVFCVSFPGMDTHTGVWNSLLEYLFQIFGSLKCWKSILDLLNLSCWIATVFSRVCFACAFQGLDPRVQDDGATVRHASATSECHIVDYEAVGLKLEGKMISGVDGMVIELDQACGEHSKFRLQAVLQ